MKFFEVDLAGCALVVVRNPHDLSGSLLRCKLGQNAREGLVSTAYTVLTAESRSGTIAVSAIGLAEVSRTSWIDTGCCHNKS
jgi:hypothetical protein